MKGFLWRMDHKLATVLGDDGESLWVKRWNGLVVV